MSLQGQIRESCFNVAKDLFEVYNNNLSNWQESNDTNTPVGPLLSGEAVITILEALQASYNLGERSEEFVDFWKDSERVNAFISGRTNFFEGQLNETKPYIDFSRNDSLGEGFETDLPQEFSQYTETVYLQARFGILAFNLQEILNLDKISLLPRRFTKSNINTLLCTNLLDSAVCNIRDDDGRKSEYGWSFSNWKDNVIPLSSAEGLEYKYNSIPYYTYHSLDTYAIASSYPSIRSYEDFLSIDVDDFFTRTLKWIEDTFIIKGKQGDITKEELKLGEIGFNVADTKLTLYDNMYVIGSWLATALFLLQLKKSPPSISENRDTVKKGLLFIVNSVLEDKYRYRMSERSFPEFVFRLGGSHWRDKQSGKSTGMLFHTKVFQDRAIHAHCLKALARYLRIFPERDIEIEDALHRLGSYVLKLRRGGDAWGKYTWEKHKYSFFYTSRAVSALSELGLLLLEHPQFAALPPFEQDVSDADVIVQQSVNPALIRSEIRNAFLNIISTFDSSPNQLNGNPLNEETMAQIKSDISEDIYRYIDDQVKQLEKRLISNIMEIQTGSTNCTNDIVELQRKVNELTKNTSRLLNSDSRKPKRTALKDEPPDID